MKRVNALSKPNILCPLFVLVHIFTMLDLIVKRKISFIAFPVFESTKFYLYKSL